MSRDVTILFLIDGTTNFVHGFPFVCVSIGLILEKVPVLGVIHNPFLKQTVRTSLATYLTCRALNIVFTLSIVL